LIRSAGLVFVHTDEMRRHLVERERPRAPVIVIPHGVGRSGSTALPKEPRLLFFGRISEYKGLNILLDAMMIVWQRIPDARLTIAGRGRVPDHPGLADPRVIVRNEYIPEMDVESVFAQARCIVLPYIEASQSGVGTEAKQFGRPLVVTDVGGLPDLVADHAGRVVPPSRPTELADALVEVLATPGLAETMARRASAFVSHSGWDRVAQRSLEAYSQQLHA
jgi:glycosyltransferase involved in cell wall biosynthesis